MLANLGKSFKLLNLLILGTLILSSCKSDVEEKQGLSSKNVIIIDSFKMKSPTAVTENDIKNSLIIEKIYPFILCISDAAVGQKIERRPVVLQGISLDTDMTNTSGCLEWRQTINFSYKSADRCHVIKTQIILKDSNITKDFSYAIDTVADTVVDLARSKGCTAQQELTKKKRVEKEIKRQKEKANAVTKDQDSKDSQSDNDTELAYDQTIDPLNQVLTLQEIKGVWVGQRGTNGAPTVRSDVEKLEYGADMQSCVKTQIDDVALTNTNIEISISGEKKIYKTNTTEQGCFRVLVFLEYKQYSYSRWLEKKLTIKVLSGKLKGEKISRNFFVNPWEHNGRTFLIDAQARASTKTNITKSPNPQNNRISIDGIMYILIGNDLENFKVNDYLNLTTSKTYQVVLNPRIDRGYRFSKEANAQYEKMHDGKFKLKFMIFAPNEGDIQITESNYNKFTYITGAETVVEVKDGIINTLIKLPVRLTDMPRVAMRTVSVFKLEPINDIGLRNTVVTGFFKAKIPWIKTNVLQSKTLQDNSVGNSSAYDPEKHGKNLERLAENIKEKTAGEINDGVVDRENFKSLDSDDDFMNDINKKGYKDFIQKHFENIKHYEKNTIYGISKKLKRADPSQLFVESLNKKFAKVVQQKVLSNNPKQLVSLQEGAINSLYDYNYKEESELIKQPTYAAITQALCIKTFSKKSEDREKCIEKPSTFFGIYRTMHAKKIRHTAPQHSFPLNLSIGSFLSTSTYSSDYSWTSKRIGADLGLKLPMGDVFSAGVRVYEYSKGVAKNKGTNISSNDNVSQNLQITVEKFTLGIDGQFKKCVTLTGKEYISEKVKKEMDMVRRLSGKKKMKKRSSSMLSKIDVAYYFCDNEINTSVNESWYYMQAYTPSFTMLMDSFGPTEIKFIQVIRGEDNYAQMRKVFEEKTKNYVIEKRSNTSDPDEKLLKDWGHLIHPDESPSTATQLLIQGFNKAYTGTISRNEELDEK
jgi:hypothetical protein